MPKSAFFAYPSSPAFIGAGIKAAAATVESSELVITPWPSMVIQGIQITSLIREKILEADFLSIDLTYPNFNVYYEADWAIGQGKPIVPTLNVSVDRAVKNALLTGIFDTIGWISYENAESLAEQLKSAAPRALRESYFKEKDHSQPLFVLDSVAKTDFRNHIASSVSNSQVGIRNFDPYETPRLSASDAISGVCSSAGVIIPLISEEIQDSIRHNLRAAFLAGLAHGFDIDPLIIQYNDEPAPVDFRDDINTGRTKREVQKAVDEYCK